MKLVKPSYYKEFKCIAGACTDTCCAGWEVDVDPKSYKYYKSVKGAFGKRLKSVMIPQEDGGCSFKLKEKLRCPFLNDENLCDLFTALGEDKLCDTCAEFPRFINSYGMVKEMGLAPSCKTAGEIFYSYKEKIKYISEEVDDPIEPNDIDPELYIRLRYARKTAFEFINDEEISIYQSLKLYLEYCKELQTCVSYGAYYKISQIRDKYKDYKLLLKKMSSPEIDASKIVNDDLCKLIKHLYGTFRGIEIINKDYSTFIEDSQHYLEAIDYNDLSLEKDLKAYIKDRFGDEDYVKGLKNLADYYVFRYFLDSVNDYNVRLKGRIAVLGLMAVIYMEMVYEKTYGKDCDFTMRVDIAHLYSRQFEHSYTNHQIMCSRIDRIPVGKALTERMLELIKL